MFLLEPFRIAERRSRHTVLCFTSSCLGLCSRAGAGAGGSCGVSALQGGSGMHSRSAVVALGAGMGSAASCLLGCGVIGGTGGWSRGAFASLTRALGLCPCSGAGFHGEHAQLHRDRPVKGLGAPGSPAGRAVRLMRGQGGDLRRRNYQEQPLLPGRVCLKARCGRASVAERSKGRVLRLLLLKQSALMSGLDFR